jgi:signal transduction histidine kinase
VLTRSENIIILQKFLDNLPSMIAYWDKHLINKFSNAAYQTFFQMSSDEIFNKHITDVIGIDTYNKNLPHITGVLKGKEQCFERELIKNGKSANTQIFYIPDILNGEVLGFYVLVNDVSNIKKIENEKNELYQKLIQSSKMIALGEMAGGIAHEINNPLSIINMNANFAKDLLDDYDMDKEKLQNFISIILSTTNRIEKIITGLQFFSQERPKDPFVLTSINSIIDDTTSFCLEKIKSKKISFMQSKIGEGLKIECRPIQISQVLLNLLNNAADAIEHLEHRWISLVVRDKGGSIEILIIDSGAGISAENADKIMQPFFTTKEAGKGTGLGLSISKGIVENHRGTIRFDLLAKNTTVILELPKFQT